MSLNLEYELIEYPVELRVGLKVSMRSFSVGVLRKDGISMKKKSKDSKPMLWKDL